MNNIRWVQEDKHPFESVIESSKFRAVVLRLGFHREVWSVFAKDDIGYRQLAVGYVSTRKDGIAAAENELRKLFPEVDLDSSL